MCAECIQVEGEVKNESLSIDYRYGGSDMCNG